MSSALGLLVLRVLVGGLIASHGAQKLFGWFHGSGIDGTGAYFGSLRYPNGRFMAVVAGLTEAAAGVALALGLLTPLASAALVGLTLNIAVAGHGENGFWNHNPRPGWEYPLVLSAIGAGVAFTGPGRYALDNLLGVPRADPWFGAGAIALGVIVGVSFLGLRRPAHRSFSSARSVQSIDV